MSRLIQMGGQMGAQMRDEKHQNREARKRYAAILKGYELDDEQIQAMSIGEMEGTVEQMETNRVREREQMQAQAAQQQMEMQRMQMEQMQQQQAAQQRYQDLLRDGGTMQSNPNAPFTNEYAQQLQQLLQNDNFAHSVGMNQAAGGPMPRDVVEHYRPEAPPWQPKVAPAEDFGGRPGDQVFMQSPNSAQLIRQEEEPARRKATVELLVDGAEAAEAKGNAEKARLLRQAAANAAAGNKGIDQLSRALMMGDITAEQFTQMMMAGFGQGMQADAPDAPAAPAPPPVNQQTFFEGL